MKQYNIIFIENQTTSGMNVNIAKGASQPPKNKILFRLDISNMLLYSPRKNMANVIDEYSTLYPATNSASASGKSNGARLVSAKDEIKKISANGNNGKINQIERCANTISVKLNDPTQRTTGKIIKPRATS